jgi:dihydroorotate dehydrogenase (fumarate)
VTLPLAVKLSPFFSSLPYMAQRLARAGARGLVLFNRFYQPDIDLDTLQVKPRLVLSDSDDLRLPLRWIAILYGRVQADLALTSGVHTAADVLKGLLAGARVTMLASELIQNGVGRLSQILEDLNAWLFEHGYESVAQIRGRLSQLSVAEPAAFERAQYLKVLAAPFYFDSKALPHLIVKG